MKRKIGIFPAETHWEGHRPLDNLVLGTMNDELRRLDAKHLEKMHGLRKTVKMLAFEKKEKADPNSMYDAFQLFEVSTLNELVKVEIRIGINWPVPI